MRHIAAIAISKTPVRFPRWCMGDDIKLCTLNVPQHHNLRQTKFRNFRLGFADPCGDKEFMNLVALAQEQTCLPKRI